MSDTKTVSDVRTETVEGAKELTRYMREKDIPVYLHSAPGIGKSDILRQLAAEDDSGFIDVRVGTMLPEDLTGIPVPDLEKKLAVWLRAAFWPDLKRDKKRGIISFDELSDAPRNLQSCIYRVVLERQIGEYKLPPEWWPAAAGNRREDRAAAQSISTALANRFAHIHVRADADVWCNWANVNGINPMLIGFMKTRKEMIHKMDGADMLAFPTPRSWARSSKVCDAPEDLRFRLMAANVGEGGASEYESFLKMVELPDIDDVINYPMKTMIPDQPASQYALCSLLSRRLDKDNFPNIFKYISRDAYGADFATVVILDATKRDPTLCDTKTFNAWAKSNKSLHL